MIVFCEECGARYDLGPAETLDPSRKYRCSHCNETLKFFLSRILQTRLELKHNEKTITIDKNRKLITVGRRPYNDIILQSRRASRSHATIFFRKDEFILIDQSKNGTFVELEGKEMAHVRQGKLVLSGRGNISPAKKPNPT